MPRWNRIFDLTSQTSWALLILTYQHGVPLFHKYISTPKGTGECRSSKSSTCFRSTATSSSKEAHLSFYNIFKAAYKNQCARHLSVDKWAMILYCIRMYPGYIILSICLCRCSIHLQYAGHICIDRPGAWPTHAYASTSEGIVCINWSLLLQKVAQMICTRLETTWRSSSLVLLAALQVKQSRPRSPGKSHLKLKHTVFQWLALVKLQFLANSTSPKGH